MKTTGMSQRFLRIMAVLLLTFQTHAFEVDSSYTLASSFQKYHQQYPQLAIADLRLADRVRVELDREYANIEGRTLHLDLFVPHNRPPKATVILIHGGGWRSGNKSHFFPLAGALANRGYLTVTVEYRLSVEAPYPAGLIDINRAIVWLKNHAENYQIDVSKMALMGGSSGGHMAALLANTADLQLYRPPEISGDTQVQAVIDMDGILDLTSDLGLKYEDKNGRKDTAMGLWLEGNYASQTARWQQVSPAYYITGNSPPMLFISSGQARFAEGHDKVFAQLDKLGIKHQFHNFNNAPHTFWLFHPWFDQVVEKTDDFLSKQLNYANPE
ncbi:alpha/beta hydrolase fold domain-containing protein [Neptunicella sp. SCSIO 80796]|uniref:alpha/beta hydrolase fold domain-containing protein n=1 Tax=Neptunicella plasticusilytica TaxID=3117012 RepID=UPI003A4DF967